VIDVKANTQRGVIRFVDELIARVRAAGATGAILLRADAGFHNRVLRARLAAKGVQYSIGARMTKRGRHQRDRRGALADADGLPRQWAGADRRNHG
jgi:hypothetical protein